jgi:hypothetical protein
MWGKGVTVQSGGMGVDVVVVVVVVAWRDRAR